MTIIAIIMIMIKLLMAIFNQGTHFTSAVFIMAKKIIIITKIVKIREHFISYTLLKLQLFIKTCFNNTNYLSAVKYSMDPIVHQYSVLTGIGLPIVYQTVPLPLQFTCSYQSILYTMKIQSNKCYVR